MPEVLNHRLNNKKHTHIRMEMLKAVRTSTMSLWRAHPAAPIAVLCLNRRLSTVHQSLLSQVFGMLMHLCVDCVSCHRQRTIMRPTRFIMPIELAPPACNVRVCGHLTVARY
ncbi:hypothetical protein GZH46_01728 [Fragariocoptes setiger]|uniref:Uncharacterized protein n=1 Tax=Fragariocoptes setiger TaxID=1670756 RepID=A0ABQ7S8R0_9ACAR|nr:hypothetical protein GZH46_01728 [Fragariocoptes setiger]